MRRVIVPSCRSHGRWGLRFEVTGWFRRRVRFLPAAAHSRGATDPRCCGCCEDDRSPVLARLLDLMRAIAQTLDAERRSAS